MYNKNRIKSRLTFTDTDVTAETKFRFYLSTFASTITSLLQPYVTVDTTGRHFQNFAGVSRPFSRS